MANIHITYTADGQTAIDNQSDISLTGMSVSSDGSSWVACSDLSWSGTLYSGKVVAPSDDFELNHVKVFFGDTTTALCTGDTSDPIATLAKDESIVISFNPAVATRDLVTNTPSGGGGGGEIDPAVLNAKQDKVLSLTGSNQIKFSDGFGTATTVEDALVRLKNKINDTSNASTSRRLTKNAITQQQSGTYYYKLAEVVTPDVAYQTDQPNAITFSINGLMQMYVWKDIVPDDFSAYYPLQFAEINLRLHIINPGVVSLVGTYFYNEFPQGSDILVTQDSNSYYQVYLKFNRDTTAKSGTVFNIYCTSADDLILDGNIISALPEGTTVVASLTQNAIDLTALNSGDGGGGRSIPIITVEVDP